MMMSKISRRNILSGKQKKKDSERMKKNRLLITVNVLGSPGPLRLLVNQDDTVSTVIDSSLKLYARGGRLPVLGSDFKNFLLYTSNAPSDGSTDAFTYVSIHTHMRCCCALFNCSPLSSNEVIGLSGERNFVMSKKMMNNLPMAKSRTDTIAHVQAESRSWKSWLHSLNKSCKIISH
ncbi:unnamed protein product [Lactuca saligna]|uniref:DUF7054 domain-containing protein n=1 Tax=Lactuca saligna TaxID=75948 RepID=A0AA35Y5G4_LACSI|nr:unnamed protein product [Lactuca saligna]